MSARYALVEAEKAEFRIADMCRWLGVSRSGFYEWRGRPASETADRRTRLKAMIREIFTANHETYGYRRIHAVLARSGEAVSPESVRALMRELGLVACQPRPWRPVTTLGDGSHPRIPDLVARDFGADRVGAKLVGDITYIPTWEGFLYLATVIDCHSKAVVGWAMADHFRTSLISSALDMAAERMRIEPDAVFHSDRGSNYQCHSVSERGGLFADRVVVNVARGRELTGCGLPDLCSVSAHWPVPCPRVRDETFAGWTASAAD